MSRSEFEDIDLKLKDLIDEGCQFHWTQFLRVDDWWNSDRRFSITLELNKDNRFGAYGICVDIMEPICARFKTNKASSPQGDLIHIENIGIQQLNPRLAMAERTYFAASAELDRNAHWEWLQLNDSFLVAVEFRVSSLHNRQRV